MFLENGCGLTKSYQTYIFNVDFLPFVNLVY